MAKRPWITPGDILLYTDLQAVQDRNRKKLATDIQRAEGYIIHRINNNFEDDIKYPSIPESVSLATMLVAEAYAYNAGAADKDIKSETFDDYSYTVEARTIDINTLDLDALLDEYRVEKPRNGVMMRLRKL